MKEIVESYGITINRNGFCMCPFHQDNKSPSFKVYPDSYYCYGCGANGDIFTFVQEMENLTFKEAFKALGGEYEHSFSSRRKIEKIKKDRIAKARIKLQLKQRINLCCALITIYRRYADKFEPFSDEWCQNMNALQYQLAELEFLTESG